MKHVRQLGFAQNAKDLFEAKEICRLALINPQKANKEVEAIAVHPTGGPGTAADSR